MLTYIVLGIFGGASYALASLGLVLTYKTSGIFNFAFGGVAMFCAYVFSQLRDSWGLSQWISIPLLLLVVAPALGIVLEAIFRPLTEAAVEVQIVVSLGILSFFIALVPILFKGDRNRTTIFGRHTFHVAGTHMTVQQIGTLVIAIALAVGLSLVLGRTRLGMATRAVVDNRELAGLIAVNPARISQTAWIISTVFSAIFGVLLGSSEGLIFYVFPTLVLYAFFAAVFGRLRSLSLAFGGAIAMGVVQNILQKYNSSGWIARIETSLPYIALLALLLVYGSRLKEVRSSLRPLVINPTFGRERVNLWWGLGAALAAGVVLPLAFSVAIQHDLAQAMAFSIVALTLVMLTGWTGQISIAQMSFAGIGAFTVAHVAGNHPALFLPGILLGALIAIPVGLIVGLPSLRLSGIFLALSTLAFALLMDQLVFTINSISGGQTGLNITDAAIGPLSFKSYTAQFYLCLVALTLTAAGAYLLKRGPVGRRLNMVRDSSAAAVTVGANVPLTKLAVFAGCALVASVGGGLLALTQQNVNPANFSWDQSLALLLLVVVGGRTLVSGALVAGALYLVQILPTIPAVVHTYEPLGVAMTVIAIAKGAEGLPQNAVAQSRYCMEVLYRLPRPDRLLMAGAGPVADVTSSSGTPPAPPRGGNLSPTGEVPVAAPARVLSHARVRSSRG